MSFETPPRPRWRLRISLALGIVVLLVLGVVVVVGTVFRCAPGVWRKDGECVGVTDGSFSYSDELDDVTDKIRRENDRVSGMPRVATVAVLMPMTAQQDDSLSIDQIREYLEGAYLAQLSENHDRPGLKYRLALANEGRNEHAWKQVTDQLVDMVDSRENLIAVTGLGLSAPETVWGADALSAAGIPMVGYLSSDRFSSTYPGNDSAIRGLARVSPSLHQEVTAVARHLEERSATPSTAILVHDESPDDYYTADLRTNFQNAFADILAKEGSLSARYTGGPDSSGLDTQFEYIAGRLCTPNAPKTVLYAGRSNLLPIFIDQVSKLDCPSDEPITVVTGSESTDLPPPPKNNNAHVSVLYASVSDPAALSAEGNHHRDRYLDFAENLRRHFGGNPHDHESNWSVMGHDATLAATTAAARSVKNDPTVVPEPPRVLAGLLLLNHPINLVPGVSGPFMLDDDSGDRLSGPIPVLRRHESGAVVVEDLGGLDD